VCSGKAETPGGWTGIGRSVCDFWAGVNRSVPSGTSNRPEKEPYLLSVQLKIAFTESRAG
jgi:hypothetical protein